jgi:SNF2 family DNA or RNA helicase
MLSLLLDRKNESLIVPDNSYVSTLFPSAPTMDGLRVLPHDMDTFNLLRKNSIRVPHPMLTYYDWAKGEPFDVQRSTCAMLSANTRAYVLNDLGTGKTRATLWGWDYLYRKGRCGKLLVVCTKSSLNLVWAREIFSVLPHRRCRVLGGKNYTKDKRINLLNDPEADIFIINHDGIKVIDDELYARTDIDVLALDELAVYRNNSALSKDMRKFASRFQYVWGLTGKPMPNAPTDVWAQCRIITPDRVPRYFRIAQEMLMLKINQFTWVPKPDAVERAFRWMQPAVRYTLDDVVELPDIVYRNMDVDMSDEQMRVYRAMATDFQAAVKEKVVTALNAGVAMGKLLQVAGGWVYTGAPDYVALDAKPRLEMLVELINSSSRKVLVFVPFRHALAGISEKLTSERISNVVVHGDTADRDQIFASFQSVDDPKVIVAHPKCMAHGLTLTAADTIIWYIPTTSNDLYDQANARIRRVGQGHRQQILHLQGTPVERKIYAMLRAKQRIQNALLAMFEEATEGEK